MATKTSESSAAARVCERAEPRRNEVQRLDGAGAERIAQLETALRARDELLALAAHELRTPVTSLQLLLDSLLRARERGLPLADEAQRLRRARAQCERIARLLEELTEAERAQRCGC